LAITSAIFKKFSKILKHCENGPIFPLKQDVGSSRRNME